MNDQRGRDATSPAAMPLKGWKEVAARTWQEASSDAIGLVAAGVAFYAFLAIVPLLGAVVLTYGLLADPATVIDHMASLTTTLPEDIAKLIGDQLVGVVATSGESKGLGLLVALAVALFGARNAAGGLIEALNIAYEEKESRSFLGVNLLALIMTAGAVAAFVFALLAVGAAGFLGKLVPTSHPAVVLALKILTYVLLGLGGAVAAAMLYRFGPSRTNARWSWLTPGSVLFAVAWIVLTLGFGYYVARFGNYGATYGSLSAVVVLLTWIYLSAYALLFGAELNSELEHQTAVDTTVSAAQPLGERGAWVADHVADGPDDAGEARDDAGATPSLGNPPAG
ncbi:MAG: YihY/virulence factor BrkB family protein [Novosphingobium sp.]